MSNSNSLLSPRCVIKPCEKLALVPMHLRMRETAYTDSKMATSKRAAGGLERFGFKPKASRSSAGEDDIIL